MSKGKILILANDTNYTYNLRDVLIEQFVAAGYEVALASNCLGFQDELRAMGCRLIELQVDRHSKNPLSDLSLLRVIFHVLRQERPDVVLTYNIKPNVYGGMVCARLGIPYIANITGLGVAFEREGLLRRIAEALYRIGMARVACVMFQNAGDRRVFLDSKLLKPGTKVCLLPGSGVNLSKYQPIPYPDGKMVEFLFISRIMKEKGIDQYLDAAREIHARHPETRFHVCGRCEQDYEVLLRALQEEGVILYHGSISDVSEMHRICACTVHPSYYPEGMSNVLLESCASARPIITTERPGCGEIVDDGINGFVVLEKDSADLVEKIERFLSLPWEVRRDMGLAGRAKVEKEFDRLIVAQEYLKALDSIMSRVPMKAKTP